MQKPNYLQLDEYKFFNYHGERGARMHRFDSVRRNTIQVERSILFQIITPILFFMPSVYMHEIEGVWIDDSVDWRKFITLLNGDWTQSMTPVRIWHQLLMCLIMDYVYIHT